MTPFVLSMTVVALLCLISGAILGLRYSRGRAPLRRASILLCMASTAFFVPLGMGLMLTVSTRELAPFFQFLLFTYGVAMGSYMLTLAAIEIYQPPIVFQLGFFRNGAAKGRNHAR